MSSPEAIDGSFTEFPTPSSSDSSLGPFWDPSQKTMAKLIQDIRGDATLSEVRRRNLASSIRRFCEVLGYDTAQVPANHWHFRQRLKRFHPLTAGLTVKRWQTIKADVGFALRHAGFGRGQPRGLTPLIPEWAAFRDRLSKGRLNWSLSRLARYCSGLGIPPTGVTDAVMPGFLAAMRAETFKTNPDRFFRNVCGSWNQAVAALPDFGLARVTVPSFRATYTRPWAELPDRLRAEADAWLATMSKEADLLSDEGPIKPLTGC
jgi:hypothetical protein